MMRLDLGRGGLDDEITASRRSRARCRSAGACSGLRACASLNKYVVESTYSRYGYGYWTYRTKLMTGIQERENGKGDERAVQLSSLVTGVPWMSLKGLLHRRVNRSNHRSFFVVINTYAPPLPVFSGRQGLGLGHLHHRQLPNCRIDNHFSIPFCKSSCAP